jgi:hypothetical protein
LLKLFRKVFEKIENILAVPFSFQLKILKTKNEIQKLLNVLNFDENHDIAQHVASSKKLKILNANKICTFFEWY